MPVLSETMTGFALAAAGGGTVRLAWRARPLSAFVAGAGAGGVIWIDPALWLVTLVVVVAVPVGACFSARTRGLRTEDGAPTRWTARLGAGWLVLSFPAAMVWCSLHAAGWMLHRA